MAGLRQFGADIKGAFNKYRYGFVLGRILSRGGIFRGGGIFCSILEEVFCGKSVLGGIFWLLIKGAFNKYGYGFQSADLFVFHFV